MAENIRYELDGDVAVIIWDMPDRSMNVVNEASLVEFEAAVDRAIADEAAKGAVITSGKRDFLAGADLEMIESMAFGPKDPEVVFDGAGKLGTVLRKLETGGKPFVAAFPGTALGGGYEIGLACHRRICADNPKAKIGLPEVSVGLLPGAGGTQRLPRMIGIQNAMSFLIEGKQVDPAKALKAGLIDEVVPADQLLDRAKAIIAEGLDPVQPWDKKGFKLPGGAVQSPGGKQLFTGANAMLRANTYGNYPAPKAILSTVYEGAQVPIDTALKIELRYFTELVLGPVAGNMVRTLFLNTQKANKLIRRPQDVPKSEVKKLGILGAGMMGAGIAYVSAQAGIEVVLIDVSQEAAERGKAYSTRLLDKAISRGKSTEEKKAALLARITATTDYGLLEGADLVVEAVFEDRGIKAEVTAKAEAVIPETAVFASNTSTLPITGLAGASKRPENFIGLHYFSPVEKMPLVEIIRGEQTSDACLARSMDYLAQIRKTPIVVNDARGFYTSRVFGTYVNEGIGMLAEGIKPALIENAGKATGMPMPPLALADEVSLGLMVHVGEQTKKDLGDDYKPVAATPVLDLMVRQLDRVGKKSGKGFYDYPEGGKKQLWSGLSEHYATAAEQPDVDEVKKRLMYVQALETARCIEEGVITEPADCDVGAIMGWGFAPYTGGPCSLIDMVGVRTFVQECDALAAKHGERFAPPQLLRDMAEKNATFY